MNKKIGKTILLLCIFLLLAACKSETKEEPVSVIEETTEITETTEDMKMKLKIEVNGNVLYADFFENSSAEAFRKKLEERPLSVTLEDYGSFEKVGDLPWSLETNDTRITTIPGDVILYQGRMITIYYSENTWNFTYLARIPDVTKQSLLEILGQGDVTVTFSLANE
ncbi:MAG: hypothetical protein IIZ28_04970 [Erysipelotrichaceae bacterium]|nr:hypothetical protein [Erysipelotrichaceae bacterium]